MRTENQAMRDYLAGHGLPCIPYFIWSGSMKSCWRLGGVKPYPDTEKWTAELAEKLNGLGFASHMGRPLDKLDGNGGSFRVFVRGHLELLAGTIPPNGATYRPVTASCAAGLNPPEDRWSAATTR